MLFSEPAFLFFFLPTLLLLHFLTPKTLVNLLLLGASLFFYAWGERIYILPMLVSIVFNHGVGRWLGATPTVSKKRGWILGLGVGLNLLLLGFFKYCNFFVDHLNPLLSMVGLQPAMLPPIHLPIGISFFTFQAVSYQIDIYRGHTRPLANVIELGL